jgi:hypothetical protein
MQGGNERVLKPLAVELLKTPGEVNISVIGGTIECVSEEIRVPGTVRDSVTTELVHSGPTHHSMEPFRISDGTIKIPSGVLDSIFNNEVLKSPRARRVGYSASGNGRCSHGNQTQRFADLLILRRLRLHDVFVAHEKLGEGAWLSGQAGRIRQGKDYKPHEWYSLCVIFVLKEGLNRVFQGPDKSGQISKRGRERAVANGHWMERARD